MLTEKLKNLKLPPLCDRQTMLDTLLREEYGQIPCPPESICFETEENFIPNFCAGKAKACRITAKCIINGKYFSFPFYTVIPAEKGKYPFFIHISFRDSVPDRYMPSEELIDNGFAVLSFCYEDVTADNNDFTNGLAGVLFEDGKRAPDSAGKLAMWAWAAQRVMDYAQGLECLDISHSVVCGHSRLGKTALLTAATDTRFAFAYSNNSGCSGAALSRGTKGESIADICRVFPYWFCENYLKYSNNEEAMPFDQHWLMAAIAPRFVCVGSASLDAWADPLFEQLGCMAASPAYRSYGRQGFVCPDRQAEVGEFFFEGSIGYHLRKGLHYFSRDDWQRLMAFVKSH